MTVAQTSINAYREHRASGKVGAQAKAILDFMNLGESYSRRELHVLTGLELSSICGRVNKLLKMGMLKEGSKRKCMVTKKTVSPVIKDSLF
jgi:hypothetical protein